MFKEIKIIAMCCSGLLIGACGGGGGDSSAGNSTGFFGQPLYKYDVTSEVSVDKVHLDIFRDRYDLQSGVELLTIEDILGRDANAFFDASTGGADYVLTATRLFAIPNITEAHQSLKAFRTLQVSADGKVDKVPYSPEGFTDDGRTQWQFDTIDLSGKPISAEMPDFMSTAPRATASTALIAANPVFPAGSVAYHLVSIWTRDNAIEFSPRDKTDKTSLDAWSASAFFPPGSIPSGLTEMNFTWANGIPVRCYMDPGDNHSCGVLFEGYVYRANYQAATASPKPMKEPWVLYNKTAADAYKTAIQRYVMADTPLP